MVVLCGIYDYIYYHNILLCHIFDLVFCISSSTRDTGAWTTHPKLNSIERLGMNFFKDGRLYSSIEKYMIRV
jgi:hypothetical protein